MSVILLTIEFHIAERFELFENNSAFLQTQTARKNAKIGPDDV